MRETQPDFSPCSLRVVEMASAFIVCNNQRRIIKDFHSNFVLFQLDSTSVQGNVISSAVRQRNFRE